MLYEIKENFKVTRKGETHLFYEGEIIDSMLYPEAVMEYILKNYEVYNVTKDSLLNFIQGLNTELKEKETIELSALKKSIISLKSEIAILNTYLKNM